MHFQAFGNLGKKLSDVHAKALEGKSALRVKLKSAAVV
jgi:hypothetical protein